MINPTCLSVNSTPSKLADLSSELRAKQQALDHWFGDFNKALVAFSGGVDSSLVAWLAWHHMGEGALAVTSDSASLKRSDLALCRRLTSEWGLHHQIITTEEMSQVGYRANGFDRCYFCKRTLFARLSQLAQSHQGAVLLSGTNADDLKGHRPGLQAAAEFGVRAPLAECGIKKTEVRALAYFYQLAVADKPQTPCLASRVAYGIEIDHQLLSRIEEAEDWLHCLGLSQLRVRHHGKIALIEVLLEESPLLLTNRKQVHQKMCSLGWTHVALDLLGFRSGALNEGINKDQNISWQNRSKI